MFMKKAHTLYVDREVEDKNSKRFYNKINISELVQHIEIWKMHKNWVRESRVVLPHLLCTPLSFSTGA